MIDIILVLIFAAIINIGVPVFIIHLGVYYGMRRLRRWEDKKQQKEYNKLLGGAKPRKSK